jgi:hypothetical protein
MFIQYEVWGVADGREELIECVPTLKEAEEIVEVESLVTDLYEELFILEDRDDELKEIKRITL